MVVKYIKKRYLLFEIHSEKNISFEDIEKAIKDKFKELFGEVGLSEANIKLLNIPYAPLFTISINYKYIEKLKFSLGMIINIDNSKVILRSLKVYGTLKKINKLKGGN